MKNEEIKKELFVSEIRYILENYILPIIDKRGNLRLVNKSSRNDELVSFFQDDKTGKESFRFYPCLGNKSFPSPFYFETGTYSTPAIKKRAEIIFREMLKSAEYSYYNGKIRKQRDYGSKLYKRDSFKKGCLDLAFELGICAWLAPTERDSIVFHSILCRMIEWANRTYEGKKVPFGIIVDFDKELPIDTVSYLKFLENDSSAVFSDGIFSGIMLDKAGRLDSFITRSNASDSHDIDREVFIPYQFADIAQHCTNKKIGIIVLVSGEILLVKQQSLCFAKRANKWVTFDWERVYTKLKPYFLRDSNISTDDIRKKIQAIYITLLDVSFAHTGGCLAILIPGSEDKVASLITERLDLLEDDKSYAQISTQSKERMQVLKYLLEDKNHSSIRSFFEIEKPLRKEILSLDGATVVSLDGSFFCAGSIISVPGGSSGGGRAAAARRLGKVGVGIKISEDGYIEAFGIPLDHEKDKDSEVLLFRIK